MNTEEILNEISKEESFDEPQEIEEEVKVKSDEELIQELADEKGVSVEVIKDLMDKFQNKKGELSDRSGKKKKEKFKQELTFKDVRLADRAIFMEGVVPDAVHTVTKEEGIVILDIEDISEKELNRVKAQIMSNKIKYESARAMKNTGTVTTSVGKGLFGGLKGFGKGVKKSFQEELKKLY